MPTLFKIYKESQKVKIQICNQQVGGSSPSTSSKSPQAACGDFSIKTTGVVASALTSLKARESLINQGFTGFLFSHLSTRR